ncbi:hypothetical protein MMPV_008658 [Pyropia vietnamensis]
MASAELRLAALRARLTSARTANTRAAEAEAVATATAAAVAAGAAPPPGSHKRSAHGLVGEEEADVGPPGNPVGGGDGGRQRRRQRRRRGAGPDGGRSQADGGPAVLGVDATALTMTVSAGAAAAAADAAAAARPAAAGLPLEDRVLLAHERRVAAAVGGRRRQAATAAAAAAAGAGGTPLAPAVAGTVAASDSGGGGSSGGGAEAMPYGSSRPTAAAVARMVAEAADRRARRSAYSRPRASTAESRDETAINESNRAFNARVDRAFGKDTRELREALERGSAL